MKYTSTIEYTGNRATGYTYLVGVNLLDERGYIYQFGTRNPKLETSLKEARYCALYCRTHPDVYAQDCNHKITPT